MPLHLPRTDGLRHRRRSVRHRGALAAAVVAIVLVPANTFAAPGAGAVSTRDAPPGAFSISAVVTQAARRFGITENWIWAVMRVESAGNTRAISPKGAMGLMQIMPATWARMTARYELGGDPFDMRANVHAGTAYLREMFDRYGDLATALAAYNAGPGRADDWRWRGRPLPAETTAYVARIVPAVGALSGGAGAVPVSIPVAQTVAVQPSWRGSGLFVARSDDAATDATSTSRSTAIMQPDGASASTATPPSAQAIMRHRGLFVTGFGDGKR